MCIWSIGISFLGFILTTEVVKMNLSWISTIKNWLSPKSFCEIQVFLGFANFYHYFIWEFSKIVGRLTAILKGSSKGKFPEMNFYLTKNAESSFYQLCSAFTTTPILHHFDPLLFICMETDALDFAISGILSQQHLKTGYWHSVPFWSRKKTVTEMNYGISKSEILAIVERCRGYVR